eukprot:scaffold1299_cov385-Pavlova_lutheri.AAC.18
MIVDFDGPYAGSVGDANIWRRSNMKQRLGAIVRDLGEEVTLYANGAYPSMELLCRPFKGNICADKATFKGDMSKSRQSFE